MMSVTASSQASSISWTAYSIKRRKRWRIDGGRASLTPWMPAVRVMLPRDVLAVVASLFLFLKGAAVRHDDSSVARYE